VAQGTKKVRKGGEKMKPRRGTGSIYKRGDVYWVKYYRNGRAYRESANSDKERDARKILKKRLGEIALSRFNGPEAERVTVRILSQDLLNDYRTNGKGSLEGVEYRLKHLLPMFGDFKAHEVGTDLVRKYIAMRQEEKASNATINRELAALKRMFNLGIEAEKIYRKPHIPMLQENNIRKGFFEHGEFVALRKALTDDLQPVVNFAYYTGWRKREILSLRWSQVDLAAKAVRLEPGTTKSGEGRSIMLEGELLETMRKQWERRIVAKISGQSPTLLCSYVFHRKGQPIRDFSDSWETACKATGLTGRLFHDFRRTAIRNMIRAGVPERVAMTVSGHKTRSVFDRYNIVSEEDLKEAARKTWEHAQVMEKAATVVSLKSGGAR